MFKILLRKFSVSQDPAKFEKALEYLNENKASFGLELDFMKLRIQSRLHFKHIMGDKLEWDAWFKSCMDDICKVARDNFNNIKEFQSIQNMHELMISLAVENIIFKGVQLDKDSTKLATSLEESKQAGDTAF